MAYVHLVLVAAFIQYIVFGMRVSAMRGKHGIKAPTMTGHPEFERMNRIHQNTLEALVVWAPLLLLATQYRAPLQVAGIGALFIIGREVYRISYLADPSKRTFGFALCGASTVMLMVIVAWGAITSL
jgi:glutathione S-transferase